LRKLLCVVALMIVYPTVAHAENLVLPDEIWTAQGWKNTESDYLPGVTHSESGWVPVSWYGGTNAKRQEALKAQCVAARTYLLRYLNANGVNAKIPIGPHFQAWTQDYAPHSVSAAQNSAGVVMTWQGQVITGNYASGAWPVDAEGWPKAPSTYGISNAATWADATTRYLQGNLDKGDGFSWTWVLLTINEGRSGDNIIKTIQAGNHARNRGSLGQYRSLWLAHKKGYEMGSILRYWYGADVTIEGAPQGNQQDPPPLGGGPGQEDPPPADPPPAVNAPDPPAGLSPGGGETVSMASVVLMWGAVPGATSYDVAIQYSVAGVWQNYTTYNPAGTATTFWPAVDPAEFRFRVRANTNAGQTGWSFWSQFNFGTVAQGPADPPPVADAPGAPTGLWPADGKDIDTDSVTLQWGEIPGADGYEVHIQYSDGGPFKNYYTYSPWDADVTFWPSIAPASYQWRVRAKKSGQWSAWSGYAVFDFGGGVAQQPPEPPPQVDVLSAPWGLSPNGGTITTDSVTLSWSKPAGATGQEVRIESLNGGVWTDYYTYTPSGSSKVFWPAMDSGQLRFKVRVQNEAGWSSWSSWATFSYGVSQPPADPPDEPATSTPGALWPSGGASVGTQDVTLSWSAVDGAGGYEVSIEWSNKGLWQDYYTYNPSAAKTTFWPQVDATKYRWRVRAKMGAGNGAWSTWAEFWFAG